MSVFLTTVPVHAFEALTPMSNALVMQSELCGSNFRFLSLAPIMLKLICLCRRAIQNKRNMLESLQKRCTAAQSKLEGEYSHLGSLESKTKELENLRKVLCLAVMCSITLCCALHLTSCGSITASRARLSPSAAKCAIMLCADCCMWGVHASSPYEY